MKAIKFSPKKNRLLPTILIVGTICFLVFVILFYRNNQIVEMDQYDIMFSYESIPEPVFSVPEGIYDQPFELKMNAPEGYTIYYTTDGSIPTIHSARYKAPITVDPRKNPNEKMQTIPTSPAWLPPLGLGLQNHAVTIRARCLKDGVGYGKTRNVIYSEPTIRQHQGFRVVHILMEADSLFAPKRGIYVLGQKYYSKKTRFAEDFLEDKPWYYYPANYWEKGKKWKRPAEFILMDLSGKTLFEQAVALGLRGNVSRAFPQKSFKITADSLRGDSIFHYHFFNELNKDTFKDIVLRSRGNDSGITFLDAMLRQVVKETGLLDVQESDPVVAYINGNYWGIHNILENIDENFFAIRYGSTLDMIDILEYKKDIELQYGQEESLQSFKDLIHYVKENSLADEKAYQYVCTQMDIDNFIDYMIVETFFVNFDWPYNNIRLYRIEVQTDVMAQKNVEAGKWRWQLFDFDWCMRLSPSTNAIERLKNEFPNEFVTTLFLGLLENSEFKEKFRARYEFVINRELTTEKVLHHIKYFEEKYQHEIVRQIERWRSPKNYKKWLTLIEQTKDFARKRPGIVLEQLKDINSYNMNGANKNE